MNKDIIIIDNYDSFTYNLVQIVEELVHDDVRVVRNDQIEIGDISTYTSIILSPGPGLPDEAGLLKEIISTYSPSKKILGVCLGLQAIGEVFGSQLRNLNRVFHGVGTSVSKTETKSKLFDGLDDEFMVGRYHSWVIHKETLSDELLVTSVDKSEEIMAIQHREYNVHGVQFHPESILTPDGKKIMHNFIFNC